MDTHYRQISAVLVLMMGLNEKNKIRYNQAYSFKAKLIYGFTTGQRLYLSSHDLKKPQFNVLQNYNLPKGTNEYVTWNPRIIEAFCSF